MRVILRMAFTELHSPGDATVALCSQTPLLSLIDEARLVVIEIM